MKPSKEFKQPVYSKNLEQMDPIQSPQKSSSKKPLLIAVVITVICLLLVAGSLTALFWLHHTNTPASTAANTPASTTDDAIREPSQTTVRSDIPESALVNPQNGHSYFVYPDSLNWVDAKVFCQSLGGHLVTISDEQEQAFVEQLAQTCSERTNFWLGGSYDPDTDTWKWIDGTPFTYTNWDSWDNDGIEMSQPDNYTGDEWYIRFGKSDQTYETWEEHAGRWNDISNEAGDDNNDVPLRSFGFICEWD